MMASAAAALGTISLLPLRRLAVAVVRRRSGDHSPFSSPHATVTMASPDAIAGSQRDCSFSSPPSTSATVAIAAPMNGPGVAA